jgi:hypothetical protein
MATWSGRFVCGGGACVAAWRDAFKHLTCSPTSSPSSPSASLLLPLTFFLRYVGFVAAFVTPCVLLIAAIAAFMGARKQYTMKPPQGSVMSRLIRVVRLAYKKNGCLRCVGACCLPARCRPRSGAAVVGAGGAGGAGAAGGASSGARGAKESTKESCLDAALSEDGVDPEDVDNTKSIARLVPIFLCLPAFWALFDQQGSAWVEQARDMNLMGMEPEQMNVLNPSTWGGRLCCRCWICEGRGSGEGGNGIQMVVSAEGEVQGAVGFIWHRTIDSWCFRDEVTGFYCVCRVLSTHEQRLCL